MVNNEISQAVTEMRAMANLLIPATFPKVTFKEEQEILLLKQRVMTIDGYEISICFSMADYGNNMLESLQLQGVFAPFLPFIVVCKLGRAFLGEENISYIEFFRNKRNVYCWTLRTVDGRPAPPDKAAKLGSYEGFNFNILEPGAVDLY